MLIALLAILGVNLIVIVALLAVVLSRKRWVKRQPGAFRGAIRVSSGEIDGLRPKWARGYGRWVRDVLVWTKAPFFFRNELVTGDGLDQQRPAGPDEVKRLGDHPIIVQLRSDSATVEVAAHDKESGAAVGTVSRVRRCWAETRRRRLNHSPRTGSDMPEGLSAAEVGKEIAEHREHAEHAERGTHGRSRHDRVISIAEAALLSAVALLAAWSGYSAAKWGSESSLSLAKASATRTEANRFDIEATQIRTLDAVKFNSAFAAYATGNTKLFRLAVNRFRPGYRKAFDAWVATHPLKNPHARPDPSDLPQYTIAEQVHGQALDREADAQFKEGESASSTADKYVRLTVILAAILFLIGISSHFPVRAARYGLIATACVLLAVSLAQLATLPGPP